MGSAGEIVNKAEYPNHVWNYDFVEDRTERGGKLRILSIISTSIPGNAWHGLLRQYRLWQALFITLGSPWENGYIESFFDKLRDECLNREVFRNGRGGTGYCGKLEAGV